MISFSFSGAARCFTLVGPDGQPLRPTTEDQALTDLGNRLRQQLRPPGPVPAAKVFGSLWNLYIHLPASAALEPNFTPWYQNTEAYIRDFASQQGLGLKLTPC